MKKIRILVADDHPVVRKGMTSYLEQHNRFAVVGEAEDGLDAIAKADELSPQVVLMDINMPKLDGLSATEVLHRENPRMKVIIFGVHISDQCAHRILASGACGYLSKGGPLADLARAIETVAAGGNFIESELTQSALRRLAGRNSDGIDHKKLSPCEREVLVAIADGLSNKEISSRLGIEGRTVETHRERVMRKLNINNVAGLTRFALIAGLVELPQASDTSCASHVH